MQRTLDGVGTASRIRNYRVRAGKSAGDVAKHLGLNEAWYHDLERHDHELTHTLTLFQAIELASALGVRLCDLVGLEKLPDPRISLAELPSRIEAHVARQGISIEEFEAQVGWPLQDLMKSPVSAAAESPIVFLQAVAERLGIDWLSFVP